MREDGLEVVDPPSARSHSHSHRSKPDVVDEENNEGVEEGIEGVDVNLDVDDIGVEGELGDEDVSDDDETL